MQPKVNLLDDPFSTTVLPSRHLLGLCRSHLQTGRLLREPPELISLGYSASKRLMAIGQTAPIQFPVSSLSSASSAKRKIRS